MRITLSLAEFKQVFAEFLGLLMFLFDRVCAVLFQTIELIFLVVRTNSSFIEAYTVRALESFSSRLKNHALQLVLEILNETPAKGVALVDGLLDRFRKQPARRLLNLPRFACLVELVELHSDTPLAATALQVINAYVAGKETLDMRKSVWAELNRLGLPELGRAALVMLKKTGPDEVDAEIVRNFQAEFETFIDAQEAEAREMDQVQAELGVLDMNNLSDVSNRLVTLLQSNPALRNVGLNVFQRMLLFTNDSESSLASWAFLEKMVIRATTVSGAGEVDKAVRMSAIDMSTFLKAQKAKPAAAASFAGGGEYGAPPSAAVGAAVVVAAANAEGAGAPPPPPPGVGGPPPPPPPPAPQAGESFAPPPPPGGGPPPPPPPPGGPPPPPPPPGGGPPGPPPPPGGPPGPPPPPGAGPARSNANAAPAYTGPVPSKKVKPLFWTKLSPFQAQGSIWAEPRDVRIKLAPDEVEELFMVRETAVGGAEEQALRESSNKKVELVTLLDMKRANNVNIMLSQFRDMSFDELRAAIGSADSSKLTADKLGMLVNYLPTDEEATLLADYQGDRTKLGKAELFYLAMLQLPRFSAKARGFHVRTEFDTRIATLSGEIASLREAALEISQGTELRAVVEAVLVLGNFLNAGTARGNAAGYKLDALSKLKTTKATNESKMTLTQYLVMLMEREYPPAAKLDAKFPSLGDALRLSFSELSGDLEKLLGQLGEVEREVAASAVDSEQWAAKMGTFVSRARLEVQKNKVREEQKENFCCWKMTVLD